MLTKGELIWGPMMRMSGPPAFSELDRLIMATRKYTANAAVEALIEAGQVFVKGKKNYFYVIPELKPITEES